MRRIEGRIPDAHCHLADLPDPEGALVEAEGEGVGPIVAVGMGGEDAGAILRLRDGHPGRVLAAVGLHPSRVPGLTDERLATEVERIELLAAAADVIGEVGLDHKDARDRSQQRRQRETLDRMVDLARRRSLPLNLHSRRADREVMEIASCFVRDTGLGALLHWFTHSRKLARACADSGVFISVGPSILTDPRQAEVAACIADDRLLVETDSPVLYDGHAATPVWARRVAERLAEIRSEPIADLAVRLEENLRVYLGRA